MNCDFTSTGTINDRGKRGSACRRCGRVIWSPHGPEKIRAICTVWPEWHELGEWVAIFLAAVGISPRRWSWVQHKLGLIEVSGCGGCEKRKAWLNTFGGKLAHSQHWAAKWLAARLVKRMKKRKHSWKYPVYALLLNATKTQTNELKFEGVACLESASGRAAKIFKTKELAERQRTRGYTIYEMRTKLELAMALHAAKSWGCRAVVFDPLESRRALQITLPIDSVIAATGAKPA